MTLLRIGLILAIGLHAALNAPIVGAQESTRSHARRQITIGDITVNDFTSSRADQTTGNFRILGAGTSAIVPDLQSHSRLVLHADEIKGRSEGAIKAAIMDFSGHVAYEIDQETKDSRRHISGTAGHITFRRSEGMVRLTDTVHAFVTDTATLADPAEIRSQSTVIDLKAVPYKLTLDSGETDSLLVFSPKPKQPGEKTNRVHISHFTHGEFQPGVAAAFIGSEVHGHFTSNGSGDSADLYSASILSTFDHTDLSEIYCKARVRYHAEQRLADNTVQQYAEGTARQAVLHVPDRLLVATGGCETRLYNGTELSGPGTLVSNMASIDLSARPYKYTAMGPADSNDLRFTIRPSPGSAEGPTTIRIFGYLRVLRSSNLITEFIGPYTTLDLSRQSPKRQAHILCTDLRVTMRPGNSSIERIEARENVKYTISSTALASGNGSRTLSGTADSAIATLPDTAVKGAAAARQTLKLRAAVCRLEAPDQLAGAATLHADSVEQVTDAGATIVIISGDPKTNDIVVPMSSGAQSPLHPAGVTQMHLHSFVRAQLNKDGSISETGPNALLDVDEEPLMRVSHLKADELHVSVDPATRSPVEATATGSVHYIGTQPIPQVSGKRSASQRRLEATCASLKYNVTSTQVTLLGGANGTLTEPITLAEPCDFRADKVVAELQGPYSSLALFDSVDSARPATADVRLALASKQKSSPPLSGVGPKPNAAQESPLRIHLYRFRTARLISGILAQADGPGTAIEMQRADGNSRAYLTAPSISLKFADDGQSLDSALADGGVVFDAQTRRDISVQSIRGTADALETRGALDTVRASGHVNMTFTDPTTIEGPGTLRTRELTAFIGQPAYTYNCSGDSAENDINFTLVESAKPAAPGRAAKSTEPPGHTSVHAYQFNDAALQPGSAVTLTGPSTHLDLVRPEKHEHSEVRAPRITAVLSETSGTLSNANASGGVQFAFVMPASGSSEQSYKGTAASVDYTVLSDQEIDMTGPLAIDVVNPDKFAEPGRIEGLNGKVLHLTIRDGDTRYSYDTEGVPFKMELRPILRSPKSSQHNESTDAQPAPDKAHGQ